MPSLSNPPLSSSEVLKQHASIATEQLKAIANINRLMILCVLSEKELSVTEMNAQVDLSQSALSQHLAKLREYKIVQTRRESQNIYYSIKEGIAKELIQLLHRFYCSAPSK
jgi:DNA-binding transcriptional ArsR family regulator